MKLQGRYEVEFDVILDNNYKMPFKLLENFFSDYSLIGVKSVISDSNNNIFNTASEQNEHSHVKFLKYFCGKNILRKTPHIFPHYIVLDYDKFIKELSDMHLLFIDLKENRDVYKREFLIESVI